MKKWTEAIGAGAGPDKVIQQGKSQIGFTQSTDTWPLKKTMQTEKKGIQFKPETCLWVSEALWPLLVHAITVHCYLCREKTTHCW